MHILKEEYIEEDMIMILLVNKLNLFTYFEFCMCFRGVIMQVAKCMQIR